MSVKILTDLCTIYKAHYNLTMFPLLDYATPAIIQTCGNNIKFILPHVVISAISNSFEILNVFVTFQFLQHQSLPTNNSV